MVKGIRMSTFDIQVPAEHMLASNHAEAVRRYPRPNYHERQQLIQAVNRELYTGSGSARPKNFSPARWRAAYRMVRERMTDF